MLTNSMHGKDRKGYERGAGNSRCNEFSLSHGLMWLAVICFSSPGLPDGSMSPLPTFWAKCWQWTHGPMVPPMAPMAWCPPTSLAPLAPLPPSPMMVRRVVTVSPGKMPPPTFVSGAVPAPPVYGMPVTRTVRHAGWDWGNQKWVGMATAIGVVRECS